MEDLSSPSPSPRRYCWLPNPLATRVGRLWAFFFLYVTEGISLGFAAIAVATYMRRNGVDTNDVAAK